MFIASVVWSLSFLKGGASGDARGGWGSFQTAYSNSDLHGLIAGSFKCATDRGGIASVSSEGNGDMLLAAPTVIGWIQGNPGLSGH
jgi:hypothetical protein